MSHMTGITGVMLLFNGRQILTVLGVVTHALESWHSNSSRTTANTQLLGELSVQERHVENLTTELATLKEKKDRRKEKLRLLQDESETIERTVREAKLSNLSNNNRKSELISEVKGLQNKERECLIRVEQISTELARAEEQKQVESSKLAELHGEFLSSNPGEGYNRGPYMEMRAAWRRQTPI